MKKQKNICSNNKKTQNCDIFYQNYADLSQNLPKNQLFLINGKKLTEYTINKILITNPQIFEMLSNLGVRENEKIKIICSNYFKKSYMVNVSGINFALDKSILKGIVVKWKI